MTRIILLVFLFSVILLPNYSAFAEDISKEEVYKNSGEDSKDKVVLTITFSPIKTLNEQQRTFLLTSSEALTNDGDDSDNDDLMENLMKTLKFVTRTVCYKF